MRRGISAKSPRLRAIERCASGLEWERLWRAPDSDSPRLDYREGADAERVLMLHELQSDWMQSARRGLREQENGAHERLYAVHGVRLGQAARRDPGAGVPGLGLTRFLWSAGDCAITPRRLRSFS